MKKLIPILILFISGIVRGQDTLVFKHTNYTSVWSNIHKYPYQVNWWETKSKVQCSNQEKRKDTFAPDSLDVEATDIVDDYVNSGYDRGHNCPAGSNECQTPQVQKECFYMSNMMPQPHCSNAGDWKSLETYTRSLAVQYDSVLVFSGGIGCIKKFSKDSVNVPAKTWKVFYIPRTKTYGAYLFNNTFDKQVGIKPHEVTVEDIESLTGFYFQL